MLWGPACTPQYRWIRALPTPRLAFRPWKPAAVSVGRVGLLAVPQPYDFERSLDRFTFWGVDRANVWHDGGLHRVVGGREVRIARAEGGVNVEPRGLRAFRVGVFSDPESAGDMPMNSIDLGDRLEGAVWGHLVGDAVGVPYEFRDARDIGEVEFGATGTHGQPAGTWSDDGALMLALLDSLLSVGFDTADQGRRSLAWYREGAYRPDGEVFDVGNATSEALRAIELGAPVEDAGPTHERASRNGSLMRILPLALVYRDIDDAGLIERAHRASRVTHGTAPAQVACALYVLVARRLLARSHDRAGALSMARATLRREYAASSTRPPRGARQARGVVRPRRPWVRGR